VEHMHFLGAQLININFVVICLQICGTKATS
jgi:hypothetical protein